MNRSLLKRIRRTAAPRKMKTSSSLRKDHESESMVFSEPNGTHIDDIWRNNKEPSSTSAMRRSKKRKLKGSTLSAHESVERHGHDDENRVYNEDMMRLLSDNFFKDGWYICPIPRCGKTYKSYIGLEYHIKRVIHPGAPPQLLANILGRLLNSNRQRDEDREKKRESLGGPTTSSRRLLSSFVSARQEYANVDIFPDLDTSFPLMVIYSKTATEPYMELLTRPRYEPILAKVRLEHPLPKPNFQRIEHPPRYGAPFVIPATYIRYIEPSPEEIYQTIEYDMDEEDQFWLTALNLKRRHQQKVGPVSASLFELAMDRLEKEWSIEVGMYKNLNMEDHIYPSPDESRCAVCNDNECENCNAIVFCDGCNLAVHQDCYGVPYIPEGQWLCRRCLLALDKDLKCVLCPNRGGAMKQTTDNRWAHVLCAYWIPEVGFANPVYMEPIDGIDNVPKARWKLQCYICRKKQGACIQCTHKNCFASFHVTCGRKLNLPLPMKMGENVTAVDGTHDLKVYCHRHCSSFRNQDDRIAAPLDVEELSSYEGSSGSESLSDQSRDNEEEGRSIISLSSSSSSSSSVLDTKKSMAIMPCVTTKMFEKLIDTFRTYQLGHKASFLRAISTYWTLKRRSRRGAPLLKRLMFPTPSPIVASEQDVDLDSLKTSQSDGIRYLRYNLERARILTELIQRRERLKYSLLETTKELFHAVFFPLDTLLYKLWRILSL
jgi:hypothetical protein